MNQTLLPRWPVMLLLFAFFKVFGQGNNSNHSQNVETNKGVMVQKNVIVNQLKLAARSNNIAGFNYLRILTPANHQSPQSSCDADMPKQGRVTRIYFGDNVAWSEAERFGIVTAIDPSGRRTDLLWGKLEKGVLLVGARVFNSEGKIVLSLEDNKPHLNASEIFDVKRPDTHTLIVTDTRNQDVLNIRFINKHAISVEGIFYPPPIDGHASGTKALQLPVSFMHMSCLGNNGTAMALNYQDHLPIPQSGSPPGNSQCTGNCAGINYGTQIQQYGASKPAPKSVFAELGNISDHTNDVSPQPGILPTTNVAVGAVERFTDAKFLVVCDRPCTPMKALIGTNKGSSFTETNQLTYDFFSVNGSKERSVTIVPPIDGLPSSYPDRTVSRAISYTEYDYCSNSLQ